MSAEEYLNSTHIENVDVNAENGSSSEKSTDSGVETIDAFSETYPASSDSETSPLKSINNDQVDLKNLVSHDERPGSIDSYNNSPLSSPVPNSVLNSPVIESLSYDELLPSKNENSAEDTLKSSLGTTNNVPNAISISYEENSLNTNHNLASSTTSLDEQIPTKLSCKSAYSRSAENISIIDNTNASGNNLDKETILSQFLSHKNRAAAVHLIPDNTIPKSDVKIDNVSSIDRYPRIPKEILSQDIGSIVKNVHGIFSSVSGSLKYAYNHRSAQKPNKNLKPVPNGKVMNDIFEDEVQEAIVMNGNTSNPNLEALNTLQNSLVTLENCDETKPDVSEESDAKKDIFKLQIETLEHLLFEQRKENSSLRDRLKQQEDDLHEKDQTYKEFEVKLDMMGKRVEQAEREKDAAVMRYASVECAGIEAKRAADAAAKAEKNAHAEVELLNNKLKGAHAEKQRIIQLYDDKCHELQASERELSKVREDIKELEGRLKWTQSKLRMEMDAYKDSSERAEKLTQQVAELEAAKEAAAHNATDSVKARQLEKELKECRAALILCRHEKEELDRRLSTTSQQLDSCKKERDDACTSLVDTTMEVEKLKICNLRLEEEAAELAALRAKAALADTLSGQLQRECERATQAEEALSSARALAETCSRREAAALEHVARLSQQHVAQQHGTQQHEAKAQALSADNASLRERVTSLEEECNKLRAALNEQTERRNNENRVLARKVAELTEEASDALKKLEWEKGENGVLKKKHASAIKELNRELQRALKRCEQLEAKLPQDEPSTRTGSISSLSSGESAPTEDRLQNGHGEPLPDIQVREPDRQALIERIVSLQRAAARRAERCEFLEEHSKQLTAELRNKSRLLRHMLSNMPAGAVASEDRDMNKKEIARLGGGAMAAVWGGDRGGMTLELSLEMNTRLQAVLEDTLLKNITLKENMDTLGAEISRLKERRDAK